MRRSCTSSSIDIRMLSTSSASPICEQGSLREAGLEGKPGRSHGRRTGSFLVLAE